MGELTDRVEIRRRLQADRVWSVYALGDLQPDLFPLCRWFAPDLTLLFRGFDTCILFAAGTESVAEAVRHANWPLYLQVQAPAMEIVERVARVTERKNMWRMGWNGDRSGWVDTSSARRLLADNVPALERLYADGESTGESPDFFYPSMVADGVFFGVFDGQDLLAAAGTHLFVPEEGVAALGNVYTRRDARGRGLARIVTNAVLAELAGIETVALNVRQDNAPAIRIYEGLGFRKHCPFFEGLALPAR